MSENTMKKPGAVKVILQDNEWVFIEDAINSWIKHVFSIEPTDENEDEWSEMANDAHRLKSILSKISEQT